MLILSMDEVRPGTKLAMGVVNPEQPSQELLRAGFTLDVSVIERLKGLGVPRVFVEFPGLDDLDRYLEPFLGPERQKVYEGVKSAIAISQRANGPVAPYASYYESTREFIKLLITRPENRAMLDLMSSPADEREEEVAHATAVAHLALIIGLRMEPFLIRERPRLSADRARDVTNLGVAGMLHDIGKAKMPAALRNRSVLTAAAADPAEQAEFESHPRVGYDMIRNSVEATTAAAVLNHHQRFDGQGFPATVRDDSRIVPAGSAIHPFARILSAADLFERLSVAEDGRRRANYEILDLIQKHYASWLDPEVLAALPQVLPPFSPGRRVTLSDATTAIVVGFHQNSPYLPSVRRIKLEDLELSDEVIDLRTAQELTITHVDGRAIAA